MKISQNRRGFTLIEVIIAIAMIGLIMLSFLGMYTHGHKWVFNAGVRTEEKFVNQEELESALSNESTTAISTSITISIDFDGPTGAVDVNGDQWDNGNISAFEPEY